MFLPNSMKNNKIVFIDIPPAWLPFPVVASNELLTYRDNGAGELHFRGSIQDFPETTLSEKP